MHRPINELSLHTKTRSYWPTLRIKISRRKKLAWIHTLKPAEPHIPTTRCFLLFVFYCGLINFDFTTSFLISQDLSLVHCSVSDLCIALNGLLCADVPLRVYSLTLTCIFILHDNLKSQLLAVKHTISMIVSLHKLYNFICFACMST